MKMNYLSFLFLFISLSLQAQDFKTKSISLFKNGMVFFHKTGKVNTSKGTLKLEGLPIASAPNATPTNAFARNNYNGSPVPVLFGSVWFEAKGNQILQTRVFEERQEQENPITDPAQLIQNNLNKTLTFRLKDDPVDYSGTILSVNGNNVFLRMEQGWKQVLLSQIDYFDIETPTLSTTAPMMKKVISLDFEKAIKEQELGLMYMQRGISWTPNYYLVITGDKKAKLSLKANVMNDIEDLVAVDFNFVLGIPSFQFSYMQDPLFSSQRLVDFLNSLNSRSDNRSFMTNAITTQRARVIRDINPFNASDNMQVLEDEDLFFYKKTKLSLPKGGRMLVHLLETNIEYEDIYSVLLSKGFGGTNQDEGQRNKVWHSLKFENNSGYPLTTGSIFFLKQEGEVRSPISQNQLDFVPTGQMAKVKMTQVPDISVLDSEKEIDRQRDVRNYWDLVTVEATVEVGNFKKHTVNLEVEREITGELIETDHPWETYPITRNLNADNQVNFTSWTFELKPGEKKKITYRYKVYVN